MARNIYCVKLKKQSKGLEFPPMPGPLGQQIFETVSQEAWEQWLNHQTMLINEYRLALTDAAARTFLREAMQKFLFSDEETSKPQGYVPLREGNA